LSLFAELQFQVGVGGSVILKPLSFVALAGLFDRIRMAAKSVGMFYTAFEIARLTGVLIANVSAVSQFRGTGGGACVSDPPPPNGSPDDHRDALESQLVTQPLGASGNETYYQQQMAQAQRAGLTRAAAYWALQLRSIELADFDADTAEQLKEQTEINTLVNATEIKIQGLLSGTLPISPSQTITEAVVLTMIS
jgi:hypothetical protein